MTFYNLSLVSGFSRPDQCKLAHKITKIKPSSSGRGTIELAPILILDDKTFIELEKRAVRDQLALSGWWTANDVSETLLAFMRPTAMIFYEATLALVSGGVGSVARGGARRVALFTLRRARRHIATRILARKLVVHLAKDTGKATVAGTRCFIGEFAKVYRAESRKQALASRAKERKIGSAISSSWSIGNSYFLKERGQVVRRYRQLI